MSPTTLNSLSLDFWSTATPMLLKSTLLLLASFLAALALRRSAAASRHLVWTLGIVGVLAMPLLSVALPSLDWHIAWMDREPEAQPPRTLLTTQNVDRPLRLATLPAMNSTQPLMIESANDEPTGLRVELSSFVASLRQLESQSIALLIWEFGLLGMLLYFGLGRLRLRSLERAASEHVDPLVVSDADALAALVGLRGTPRLLCSAEAVTPMTWGLWRPVLLLPAASAKWNAEQRRDVLLHELHHVKRRDAWSQGLAQIACAILWFHPLVWMAERSMRREREHACDDQVLMAGSKASSYANHLLTMARSLRCEERTAFASVAMARRSELSSRLLAVLDPKLRRGGLGRIRSLVLALLGIALLLPLAALRPVAGAAPPERPRTPSIQAVGRAPRVAVTPRVATVPRVPRVSRVESASSFVLAPGHSTSWQHNGRDGQGSWQIHRNGEHLWLEIDGEVEFAEDEKDLVALESDGYFEIGEGKGRDSRHVEIATDEDGTLIHRYFEGRREKDYDDGARQWLAEVLPRVLRSFGINAEERVERIYEDGGLDAFMDELDELESDHARRRHYAAFLELEQPTEEEQRKVLRAMARDIDSDYERAELLIGMMPQFLEDDELRESLIEIVPDLDSDYERSRVLQSALGHGQLTPEQTADLLRAARGIDSDYEAGRVLAQVAPDYLGDASVRSGYFGVVDRLGSDYERSQLLQNLLREAEQDPELAQTILQAAADIDSDFERSQVLAALLENDELTRENMLSLIEIADGVDSEFERTKLLIEIAERDIADEEVREALLHAIDRIDSEHEYGRAMRALRRGSR